MNRIAIAISKRDVLVKGTSQITHGRWPNVGISGWPNVILVDGGNVGSSVA